MTIELSPIAFVRKSRDEVRDDFWGGTRATIELADGIPPSSLDGLEEFSHAEILFVFDRLAPETIVTGARHPRGNPAWPMVGIFAQRAKARPNRLGATIVRILGRDGTRLDVAELDAVDGTPVVDIKPVFSEFLPREPVRQPAWSRDIMRDYWTADPGR
jgi:tRNA-Thr(GGU) m(6)t(6)A37 methyltransferase TsaA